MTPSRPPSRVPVRVLAATLGTALTCSVLILTPTGAAQALVGGAITGRVTNTAGVPLADLDAGASHLVAGTWVEVASVETDVDGRYDLAGLPADTYRVEISDAFDEYAAEWWDDAATVQAATDIVVTDGATSGGHDTVLGADPTALVNLSPPTITGTPAWGSKLRATPGTWSQPGATYDYSWSVSGRSRLSGSGATFELEQTAGKQPSVTVYLTVTASVPGFEDTEADAEPVVVRASSGTAGGGGSSTGLTVERRPTIRGAAVLGRTLVADRGAVSSRARASYQWLRGSTPIAGGTGRSHRVVAADVGRKLRLKVTWRRPGAGPVTATSARTAKVTR